MATGDLRLSIEGLDTVISLLNAILTRMGDMATQADVDALRARLDTAERSITDGQSALSASVGELNTALAGLRGDIESLKAALAASGVDLGPLTTSVAAVEAAASGVSGAAASMGAAVGGATALDAETPPA